MKKQNKQGQTPVGGKWTWITQELLESEAWRSMGINERRLIDFLQLELIASAGTRNGNLKAPHEHLAQFGISPGLIAPAITKAEQLGLIDTAKSYKVATIFTLTWLPTHDAPPSNRWREYRNPEVTPWPRPQNLPRKHEADGTNLPRKHEADRPKKVPRNHEVLSRKESYQGGQVISDPEVGSAGAADGEGEGAASIRVWSI